MIPSLRSLIVNSLPQEEILSLYSTYDLPEDWIYWNRRAQLELGLPEAYFDLALDRNISGQFRYLEILTKTRLSEESAVTLNNQSGEIYGIYESYAGVLEALKRNDEVMVLFFARRLSQAALVNLGKEIRNRQEFDYELIAPKIPVGPFRTAARRALHLFLGMRDFKVPPWAINTEEFAAGRESFDPSLFKAHARLREALLYLVFRGALEILPQIEEFQQRYTTLTNRDVFCAALSSGNLEVVQRLLQYSEGTLRTLLENGHFPSFAPNKRSLQLKDYVYSDIGRDPLLRNNARLANLYKDYYRAAVFGGLPQVYLMLEKLYPSLLRQEFPYYVGEAAYDREAAYYLTGRFLEYYISGERYPPKKKSSLGEGEAPLLELSESPASDIDIDIDILLRKRDSDSLVSGIVKYAKGNIDILVYFLPFFDEKSRRVLLEERVNYPLSALLLS